MMTPEEQQAFVSIISNGMTEDDIQDMESKGFHMEVMAVAKELTRFADAVAQHFDVEVVTAALEIVLDDFAQIVEHEGEEE